MAKSFGIILAFLTAFMLVNQFWRHDDSQSRFIREQTIVTLSGQTDSNIRDILLKYDSVVIQFGVGGYVKGMLETIEFLKAHPEKTVVIDGSCYSACTMLLAAPKNVLLTNRTRLFFHSGFVTKCIKGVEVNVISPSANRMMYQQFNKQQQKWIIESRAFEGLKFTEMPMPMIRDIYRDMWISTEFMPELDKDFWRNAKDDDTQVPTSCIDFIDIFDITRF